MSRQGGFGGGWSSGRSRVGRGGGGGYFNGVNTTMQKGWDPHISDGLLDQLMGGIIQVNSGATPHHPPWHQSRLSWISQRLSLGFTEGEKAAAALATASRYSKLVFAVFYGDDDRDDREP